ncbi:MAG TPA: carboxymuconolactone decarboxylase family protein [Solirubrobacteraceae bacterium]
MAAEKNPRIRPGGAREIGLVNTAIVRLIAISIGTGQAPNLFSTLARHRTLFRRWLRFAAALMPGGRLPRQDTELLILRVAHNNDCDYEWSHHKHLARQAGLTEQEIARVRSGPRSPGWSERRAALLSAADELHNARRISDELWGRLRAALDEPQLIELCMLVGHYEMLAMTLNSLAVQPDLITDQRPTLAMRLLSARRGN